MRQIRFHKIAIAIIACFICSIANGQARQQHSVMPIAQISEFQQQIKTAETVRASAQQQAALWIALAGAFEEVVDHESAENAFAHAIRLARGTDSQDLYAKALDGIATVYLQQDGPTRPSDACAGPTAGLLCDSQKEIPADVTKMLTTFAISSSDAHFQTPIGTLVLSLVQQNVINLKKFLLAIEKVNSAYVPSQPGQHK